MTNTVNSEDRDRRKIWQPTARPEWLATLNGLGSKLDMAAVVPLDEQSLMDAARRNTGLDDFDDDGWLDHFRVLLGSVEGEAQLNFFGRILTRSDLVTYLEARLRVTEAYRRNPEIEDEVITEPVFILGLGRSGTSILHETLSQDPQFRSVTMAEARFPAGIGDGHGDDRGECASRAQNHIDVVHALAPEWKSIHPWGADIPVEDIEFTYLAFCSEVWMSVFQIPTYDRYFKSQSPAYHFHWHKRILKLLQWKDRRRRWLLKNPTHMWRIPALLAAYPDAKIIFPHRDPVVTADSVVNTSGTIFHWRTDHPFDSDETASDWVDVGPRVKLWDDIIELIEKGTLPRGNFTNSLYPNFMNDPATVITQIYSDLGLPLAPDVVDRMVEFLSSRHQQGHGNRSSYSKSAADDERTQEERRLYRRYQTYFGVPDEI